MAISLTKLPSIVKTMTVQKLSISEYASNIQKYTDNVSEDVVKGIVRHLGIALTNGDASLVSCGDKTEIYIKKTS